MIDIPDIAVRYATFGELVESSRADWLSPRERSELRRLRHPGRARSWVKGRFLAKKLFVELTGATVSRFPDVELLSRTTCGRPMRPTVYYRGRSTDWSLSISHVGESILAAASLNPQVRIGVDLVPLDDGEKLSGWCFAGGDRLSSPDAQQSAQAWAVKEALFKACNVNEPFAPLRIVFDRDSAANGRFSFFGTDLTHCVKLRQWTIDRCVAALITADAAELDCALRRSA